MGCSDSVTTRALKDAVDEETIEPVVEAGLCTGCGTCAGICPRDAIELEVSARFGIYVPQVDEKRCSQCGICLRACPGHSVDFMSLNLTIFGKEPDDPLLGNYANCYIGHATDYEIRYNSASGGLVTALLIHALEQRLIDGALVTRMSHRNPMEPQPFIAKTRDEIISAAKSKYCPVPANIALKEILKGDGKFAVVGLPCHLQGIRKAEAVSRKLRERIVLHLGLFCSHADTFSGTEFIMQKYAIKEECVVQLDYRGLGWPGSMAVHMRNGQVKAIPFADHIPAHALRFFMPRRCFLCSDAISSLADITFMDAWLPEILTQDSIGRSIIVSRTRTGEALCQSAKLKRVVQLDEITSNKVAQSQGKMRLSNKDLRACFCLSRLFGHSIPSYNAEFPRSGPTNYLRALLTCFNMWISSGRNMRKFIDPILRLEWSVRRHTNRDL